MALIYRLLLTDLNGDDLPISPSTASEPTNIDEIKFKFQRSKEWHGVFFEFAEGLTFCCRAYDYLKRHYDTSGVFAEIYLFVWVRCHEGEPEEFFGQFRLDFNSLEFSEINLQSVKVNVEQADSVMKLKARYDTQVDLKSLVGVDGHALTPLTYAPYAVTLHGKSLQQVSTYLLCPEPQPIVNGDPCALVPPYPPDGINISARLFGIVDPFLAQHFIGGYCSCINEIGTTTFTGDLGFSELVIPQPCNPDDATIELRICLKVRVCYPPNTTANVALVYWAGGTPLGTLGTFNFTNSDTVNYQCFDFDVLTTVFIPVAFAGVTLRLKYDIYGTGTNPCDATLNPSIVNLSTRGRLTWVCQSTEPDTPCWSVLNYEAGVRIVDSIGGGLSKATFRSTFFGRTNSEPETYPVNGCGAFGILTTGLNIRQFPKDPSTTPVEDCTCSDGSTTTAGSPINLSLKEFYEGLNAIWCLGLGIAREGTVDVVRIEQRSYFYDKSAVVFTASDVDNFVTKPNLPFIFGKVEIGYDKFELQQGVVNGRDEFNTRRQYQFVANTVGENTLNLLSQFIASGYAIEAARRRPYMSTGTEDFDYDNDIFVICVRQDVAFLNESERDERFPVVTNVIDPASAFNLAISPRRNLDRWAYFLNIPLRGAVNPVYQFRSGEGNYVAEITEDAANCCWASGKLVENQDLDVSIPPCTTLFYAETVTFTYPLSYTEFKSIKAAPYQLIAFNVYGESTRFGFLDSLEYDLLNSQAKFVLLPAKL